MYINKFYNLKSQYIRRIASDGSNNGLPPNQNETNP